MLLSQHFVFYIVKLSVHSPSVLLSSITHPSSPKVTITNLIFGNLRSMETSALEIDGASVHACHKTNSGVQNRLPEKLSLQKAYMYCWLVHIIGLYKNKIKLNMQKMNKRSHHSTANSNQLSTTCMLPS